MYGVRDVFVWLRLPSSDSSQVGRLTAVTRLLKLIGGVTFATAMSKAVCLFTFQLSVQNEQRSLSSWKKEPYGKIGHTYYPPSNFSWIMKRSTFTICSYGSVLFMLESPTIIFILEMLYTLLYSRQKMLALVRIQSRLSIEPAPQTCQLGGVPFVQYSTLTRDGYLPSGGSVPPCIRLSCWFLSPVRIENHKC